MRFAGVLVLGLSIACGGAPPPAPVPEPEPVITPEPEPVEAPLEETLAPAMRAVIAGDASIRALVDSGQGVVHVVFATDASGQDPRADENGTIRTAERVCGDALDALIEFVDRDLQQRAELPLECVDDTCSHPAAVEYDLAGRYRFARGDEPRLQSVARIETGVTEELLAEGERFLRDELARLDGGGCGG